MQNVEKECLHLLRNLPEFLPVSSDNKLSQLPLPAESKTQNESTYKCGYFILLSVLIFNLVEILMKYSYLKIFSSLVK